MNTSTCKIAAILATALCLYSTPAKSGEATPAIADDEKEEFVPTPVETAIFECEGDVSLRFEDDANWAFVRVGDGEEVRLPLLDVYSDMGLIYSLDVGARSCSGQELCVAGWFQDLWATFDVYSGGKKHHCRAPYVGAL